MKPWIRRMRFPITMTLLLLFAVTASCTAPADTGEDRLVPDKPDVHNDGVPPAATDTTEVPISDNTGLVTIDLTHYDPATLPPEVYPPVAGPVLEGVRLTVPPELGNRELAELGMIDVTAAPFMADPTGATDATAAIQRAIEFGRLNQMVVFFPSGTYLISDTLVIRTGLSVRMNMNYAGTSPSMPNILMGSSRGGGAKLVLAANAQGFDDPNNPKPVIYYHTYRAVRSQENSKVFMIDKSEAFFNAVSNSMIANMDVDTGSYTGRAHPGAIGIHMSSAEGTAIQDVTVNATGSWSGITGAAGNGASWTNVTVIGGEVGLDMRTKTVPTPMMENIKLQGQTRAAIMTATRGALCITGLKIISDLTGPVIVQNTMFKPFDGAINLIDSEIVFNQPMAGAAIAGTLDGAELGGPVKGLYLNNVFVKHAAEVVQGKLTGNIDGWIRVDEYAYGNNPRSGGVDFTSPVYVDGDNIGNEFAVTTLNTEPPQNLESRHGWDDSFPTFESVSAVNVKQAPYYAVGDSKVDDTDALQRAIDENEIVFLPKGYYNISKTLKLHPKTKLIGVAPAFAVIMTRDVAGFATSETDPQPLVETADDPNAETVISYLSIRQPHEILKTYAGASMPMYALNWRSGGKSVIRSMLSEPLRLYGFKGDSAYKSLKLANPIIQITGHGGGKIYNTFISMDSETMAPEMRNISIRGTAGPLYMYNAEIQDSNSDGYFEISDSRNVTIYASKTESYTGYMRIANSDHIRIFGHGGLGTAASGRALFELNHVSDFIVTNIADQLNEKPKPSAIGQLSYSVFHAVRDGDFSTPASERPVMYKKGNP